MNDLKSKLINIWENSLPEKVTKKLSFSQYKVWSECPHLHYLISISKKIPYPDNDFTAFGQPFHETLERKMLHKALGENSLGDYEFFLEKYQTNVEEIIEKGTDEEDLSGEKVVLFAQAAKEHFSNIEDYLSKEFGDYEIIAVELPFEEMLDIETDHYRFLFRGMMDLVIKTPDGIYHIVDWKTSNRGWSDYKKEESIMLDQLLFYRHFLANILDVPFSEVRAHFIIFESMSQEIDHITVEQTEQDRQNLFSRLQTMIYNAFEQRRFIKTGMCGNFCECKNYYLSLTEKE